MTKTIVAVALACCLACGGWIAPHAPSTLAFAEEDWRAEFDDICAKTQDSMALTRDELRGLVMRCDKLRPRIEKLDESTAKVYLRRLQMCRDLYAFVLDSKSTQTPP